MIIYLDKNKNIFNQDLKKNFQINLKIILQNIINEIDIPIIF